MLIDLGITKPGRVWQVHNWYKRQVQIIAHTPGIPEEWLMRVLRLKPGQKRWLFQPVADEIRVAGRENFHTITLEDGWTMLKRIPDILDYKGAVPLASWLWLNATPETDGAIGARLGGVNRQRVRRWRALPVFDPLTGVRIRRRRGNPEMTPCIE